MKKFMRNIVMGLSTVILSHEVMAQGAKPPQENLYYARSIVDQSIARISSLLDRVYGGGHMPGGDWPTPPRDEMPPMPGEMGHDFPGRNPRPMPPVLTLSAAEEDDEFSSEELENDKIAGFALQGVGAGFTYLGQLIDQANMNYNSPNFWMYQQQACNKAALLIKAAIGGKVSATLPLQGLITPQDFAETEQEAYAVRNQLYCY